MKVTPANIMKFWGRLMWPPDDDHYLHARMNRLTDLPWEPWLHCGIWLSAIFTMIVGEYHLYPPLDAADWAWLILALSAPPIGFASQWMLAFHKGRLKYWALWLRMISDVGLSLAILCYLINRWYTGDLWVLDITADFILMLSMWFTLTLVARDIRLLLATERLAAHIRAGDISVEKA